MGFTERHIQARESLPNFGGGICPSCASEVSVDRSALLTDNTDYSCNHCGGITSRYKLIQESLAKINSVNWSLFASDFYIGDTPRLHVEDVVWYSMEGQNVAKWLHQETTPRAGSGERYLPSLNFTEKIALLSLQDTQAGSEPADPSPEVAVQWYRFGLSDSGAVPAWRQSLFGAARLVDDNPAAAIVLIAAGFEAYFLEAMRVAWREKHIRNDAFEILNRRNPPISNLVEWLPPVVDRPSLLDSPALHERWTNQVNKRRNDVVHRAQVHFTSEEAYESMRTALECIAFIDESALVRPHKYYVGG